jgi:hypothetical protein
MYSKEYFVDRFRDEETDELLHRYATAEITEEAKAAILLLIAERGIDTSTMAPLVVTARKAAHRRTKGSMQCDYCDSSARFSSVLDGGQRFCSTDCLVYARLMEISEDISPADILAEAQAIKRGACPVCQQSKSRIEVRTSYRVWSALVFTQWSRRALICCHSCGRIANAEAAAFSTLLGWWGLPWGLIMTPVQVVSNIAEMFRSRSEPEPSPELLQAARIELAAKRHNPRGGKLVS